MSAASAGNRRSSSRAAWKPPNPLPAISTVGRSFEAGSRSGCRFIQSPLRRTTDSGQATTAAGEPPTASYAGPLNSGSSTSEVTPFIPRAPNAADLVSDDRRCGAGDGIRFGVTSQQGIGMAVEELPDRSTGDVWQQR